MAEARRIISYYELPERVQPPKSIWHSYEKCKKWIDDHWSADSDKGKGTLDFGEDDIEVMNG